MLHLGYSYSYLYEATASELDIVGEEPRELREATGEWLGEPMGETESDDDDRAGDAFLLKRHSSKMYYS